MTRGNQRELARAKNQKKLQEQQKKKGSKDSGANQGQSLDNRKLRDADIMREKQKKAAEKAAAGASGSGGASGGK